MKQKVTLILVLCLLLACFAGCSAKDAGGTLTVACSPDYAPMEFVDATKTGQEQYVGFDIMLAKYLAEELGMKLEIKPMSFEACQTAVSLGSVDAGISGFSWEAERAENYNLSDFYYAGDNETEQVLVTLKKNAGKYTTVESLDGVKVAAQTASLQESMCKEQLPNAELVVVGDLTTALMQLKNGDFECLAVAKGQAEVFLSNDPEIAESGFRMEVDEENSGYVVLMKKGNDELTEKINAALAKAYETGLYGQWYEEAEKLAGSSAAAEVGYDDEGNEITEP